MYRFKYSSILIALAIISTISIHRASALKCWNCDSANYLSCGDPFDSSTIVQKLPSNIVSVDCSGLLARCMKVKIEGKNEQVVLRGCAQSEDDAQKFSERVEKLSKIADSSAWAKCSTCSDKDKCNGAVQYGAIALLVALPVAIAKIL